MLKDGMTLMHEHVYVDLSNVKQNLDCRLDCKDEIIAEYLELYKMGVRNIVNLTNRGMGRNVEFAREVSKKTGINILNATGFYKTPFIPSYVNEKTIDELAELLIEDIEKGIDGTDIKAEIIGEIGTSKDEMTLEEEKVFLSSIIAQRKTGVPISTHCTLGTYSLQQVEFFKKHNADLSKIVIGHVDLSGDLEYILKILDSGVYVAFDTIGKDNYMPDTTRVKMLKELEKMGYMDKIFLSEDITRKTHLLDKGGIGYTHLFTKFLPMLREAGIQEESIDKMLIYNPQKLMKKVIL